MIGPLRGEGAIHYGGIISPFNAWLIMRGLVTLPLVEVWWLQVPFRPWLAVACLIALVVFPAVWREIGTVAEAGLLARTTVFS